MPAAAGVEIVNLAAFRRDIRRAIGKLPRTVALALRKAGDPVLADLRDIPAHQSGDLAAGYRIQVRGASGFLLNVEPYAGGAEWGQHGKWKGFLRYGPPGRFGWQAIDRNETQIAQIVFDELSDVVEILGWAL